MVYLDDILKFSKSPKAQVKLVYNALKYFCNAHVTIKLKKSELYSDMVNKLGHVIHPG